MENVLGMQTAAGGAYFTAVQHEARLLGYRVVLQVADASPSACRRSAAASSSSACSAICPASSPPTSRPRRAPFPAPPSGRPSAICRRAPPARAKRIATTTSIAAAPVSHAGAGSRPYLYRVLEVTQTPLLTADRVALRVEPERFSKAKSQPLFAVEQRLVRFTRGAGQWDWEPATSGAACHKH